MNTILFDSDPAERLAQRAIDAGLYLSEDRERRFYLTLPPAEIERLNAAAKVPGKRCINPRIILDDSGAPLFATTLDAVREYLASHTGEHRTT
jgi:hypothetical protein